MIFNRKIYLVLGFLFLSLMGCKNDNIPLSPGMIITSSVVIAKDEYRFPSENLSNPVITIKGDNITVDFNGSQLIGSTNEELPDEYKGLAILIEGENVEIRNVSARGYKVGLLAKNSDSLHISYSDFSYNYKQHLRSNLERENITDWLSHHENENDQWLNYGAGIYLKNCKNAQINNNTITGGQNGLLLSGCDDGLFYNNNFSFNSGLGLGLYRSSRNKVMHNKLDWNVRGYSHNVYNRGQDSAGILVYEQSSENIFAYNSVTHSGDGFFLWAGRQTLESGKGGCNGNLIYGNDFSHAPTNGVEITFSRNYVINNRIEECDHGIWAGYSYETKILGNTFKNNNKSIAWEMGNNNDIRFNKFYNGNMGISIWENFPEALGFAKKRDVSSRKYNISDNAFIENDIALKILDTEDVLVKNNIFLENIEMIESGSSDISFVGNIINPEGKFKNSMRNMLPEEVTNFAPDPLKDGMDAMLPEDALRGRKYILVDEWGPYDFKSPRIWLRKNTNGKLQFEILGPEGNWEIKSAEGIKKLTAKKGEVPGELVAYIADQPVKNVFIELVYYGEEITDSFGKKFEPGTPYTFTYSLYEKPMEWKVKWFTFDHPRKLELPVFKNIINSTPVAVADAESIGFRWWGAPGEGIPEDNFITTAESITEFEKGAYVISLTSDNGARLYLDGNIIIDHWDTHSPEYRERIIVLEGEHTFRIEHFELNGFSTLDFSINPVRK